MDSWIWLDTCIQGSKSCTASKWLHKHGSSRVIAITHSMVVSANSPTWKRS